MRSRSAKASRYLLSLIVSRIDVGDTLALLESIAFILEFSKERFTSDFLESVWSMIHGNRKDSDAAIKSTTLPIAAHIAELLLGGSCTAVINGAQPIDSSDPLSFLSGFRGMDVLCAEHLAAIMLHLGSTKVEYAFFLPVVPLLARSRNKRLVVGCMSFLVRRLSSRRLPTSV